MHSQQQQLDLPFVEETTVRPAMRNGEVIPDRFILTVSRRPLVDALQRLCSCAEAAKILRTHKSTVERMVKDGTLPSVPAGKRRRKIPWAALMRWKTANTRAGDV